jgi:hypothetical protein
MDANIHHVLLLMQAEQLGVKTCTVNFEYDKSTLVRSEEHQQDLEDFAGGAGSSTKRTLRGVQNKANTGVVTHDYLYKTLVGVNAGDMVAVEARGQIRLAQVVEVHDEVDLSYPSALSWVVANLTGALATVKTQRAAEKAAHHKMSRGKAIRAVKEYMADQKLGDFQLLDLIPHVPNAATENALRGSQSGGTSRVLDD